MLCAGDGIVEDGQGGAWIFEPQHLISEVGQDPGVEVPLPSGVSVVERGAPEQAGSGVLALIEALPTSGLSDSGDRLACTVLPSPVFPGQGPEAPENKAEHRLLR